MDNCNNNEQILNDFKDCSVIFQGLGDQNRQMIIILLMEHEKLTVNEMTIYMKLSRPAISHHLKILRQSGLVNFNKVGKESFYFLSIQEPLQQIKELIQLIENNQ